MTDCMRADGDKGIGCKLRKLAPVHAQLGAKRRDVDLIKRREPANDVAHFAFRGPVAQPPIKFVVKSLLFRHRAAVEFSIASIDNKSDTIVACNHRLKREPPQFPETIRKTGRHVDCKRHVRVFKNGISPAQRIAIRVIEGEADKASCEVAFHHAAVHLVETDELQSRAPQSAH